MINWEPKVTLGNVVSTISSLAIAGPIAIWLINYGNDQGTLKTQIIQEIADGRESRANLFPRMDTVERSNVLEDERILTQGQALTAAQTRYLEIITTLGDIQRDVAVIKQQLQRHTGLDGKGFALDSRVGVPQSGTTILETLNTPPLMSKQP